MLQKSWWKNEKFVFELEKKKIEVIKKIDKT